MRRPLALLAGLAAIFTAPALAASPDHPAVLELFQSEGCSSCPPAEAVLNSLADRPDLIALSFEVTYWDHLGWKDRFARPEFTARQYAYAAAIGTDQVYTPQMVINGRARLVGGDPDEVAATLASYDRRDPGPALSVTGHRLTIAAEPGRAGRAAVWLVRYDPRRIDVAIRGGENTGRTLPHRNLVTGLIKLGDWTGAGATYALPPAPAGMASAILVQDGEAGPIIAARKLPEVTSLSAG